MAAPTSCGGAGLPSDSTPCCGLAPSRLLMPTISTMVRTCAAKHWSKDSSSLVRVRVRARVRVRVRVGVRVGFRV